MESGEIQILFAQTLLGDYESEEPWAAVSALRMDGSREIFEYAAAWWRSDDPLKKARAAAILCQLRRTGLADMPDAPEWIFRDESYELIASTLENEQDPIVLESAISALGHLHNPNAIPIILRYPNHPNQDVRFAVACALGSFPDDPHSVGGLVNLTSDSCSDVRDWAVFGLGVQGNSDSPAIREALYRCLNDADDDVREEAAVGLGKRRDKRLIPALRAMLNNSEITDRIAEATTELLDLAEAPREWAPADYKAALSAKFSLE
jgi:HEAT repeat protein